MCISLAVTGRGSTRWLGSDRRAFGGGKEADQWALVSPDGVWASENAVVFEGVPLPLVVGLARARASLDLSHEGIVSLGSLAFS